MVEVTRGGRTTFVVRPNCSLTWRGLFACYAVVLLFAGSIALTFAWLGYWPVLPFAGLELAALGAALVITRRRCGRCERIQVDDENILVSGERGTHRLPTAWARVSLRRAQGRRGRLSLSMHGREVEIGRFLTEPERSCLAAHLRSTLRHRSAWACV